MSREIVASMPVDLPDGRRVRVIAYDDGSLRFRVSDAPYVLAEVFMTGKSTDHTILRLDPAPGSWPRPFGLVPLIRLELKRIGATKFKLYVPPDRAQFQAKDFEEGQVELSSDLEGVVQDQGHLLVALRRVQTNAGDDGIAAELFGE